MARKKGSSKGNPFGIILAVVAVAGVAILGYIVSRPTKVLTLDPSLPPIAAAGIVKGSPDALVEIIEFADFECPGCAHFATLTGPDVMSRLVETGEVRIRFMDFPLIDIHPNAVAAHNAAHCANEQDRFWEMHDAIFRTQGEWTVLATRSPKRVFSRLAREVGLDTKEWESCYDSERMLPVIAANRAEGARIRVNATPSFIIGDQLIPGALSFDQINQLVTQAKIQVMAAQSEAIGGPVTAP